jgi:hypothetical protein
MAKQQVSELERKALTYGTFLPSPSAREEQVFRALWADRFAGNLKHRYPIAVRAGRRRTDRCAPAPGGVQ